ncbi:MAG: 4-hydroxy-3-methylbut-2-enyl diphosphate reductase [Bacteroidales bacterium]|jgi:4-hydroxy-3-methylbut-2-enyl diphosphate reductase|nr:4-hydroxy-3-methylbut-2-enyl diphosphate reductase [Bacteroidales bacterium]
MNSTVAIEIDEGSGFCFGVVNAIQKAEDALKSGETLYCLGDIVHNNMEMNRLEKMGLKTIDREEFEKIENKTVLLRAHGEPPSTYTKAQQNKTHLIDATCPVVLRLQRNVSMAYLKSLEDNGQVVIYGKIGHAEVNGLVGQTKGKAIVIESLDDMSKVDLTRPVRLFSQTTMMVDKFLEIKAAFEQNVANEDILEVHNSVCHQVSGRIEGLQKFSKRNDVVVFVSGQKSSNGKALFGECLKTNKHSYMVADENQVQLNWFLEAQSIGICGATSTPDWLMKKVAKHIKAIV